MSPFSGHHHESRGGTPTSPPAESSPTNRPKWDSSSKRKNPISAVDKDKVSAAVQSRLMFAEPPKVNRRLSTKDVPVPGIAGDKGKTYHHGDHGHRHGHAPGHHGGAHKHELGSPGFSQKVKRGSKIINKHSWL